MVERLRAEGRIVVMAGDGINDASALAAVHAGIAMGTGTDVAVESAGITLVIGDLRGIVRARRLSPATLRNVRQNLLFTFAYNTLGIPVAAGLVYPFFGLLLSPNRVLAPSTVVESPGVDSGRSNDLLHPHAPRRDRAALERRAPGRRRVRRGRVLRRRERLHLPEPPAWSRLRLLPAPGR